MSKHTPGPWRYDRCNGSPTTGEHMIAGGKPGYLAEVRDCGSGDVSANARLIAAAPDLLEACKRMIGSLGVMVCDADSCGDIVFARAAIAKATGETL